ncbi:MAG TPA: hypothetical protein VNW15_07040 [Rhizomicrobium sp.]|nr:hypothetical protein [Rhizomicrobium sp.]
MVLKFAAALALACGFWTSAAWADETSDDIKCLAVSLKLSASDDPDNQSAGMLSTMYWLGRLDGIVPRPDLEKQMQAGAFDMRPVDEKAEAVRCTAALQSRGETLTKLGQELDQRQNSN